MRNLTKPLMDLSLSRVWDLISTPSQIPARLGTPPESTLAEVIRTVCQDVGPDEVEDCRLEYLRNHEFFSQMNIKWCQEFGWPTNTTKGIVRVTL